MRRVVLGTSVFLLGACATVSMTPGQTTVTAEATASQTALRSASDSFSENAVKKGWVTKTGSIFGLARILMHGNQNSDEGIPAYAEQIGAGKLEASIIFTRIARDADTARSKLSAVSELARILLASVDEDAASRADVMSYERALVNAQKAYRSFARAADIAAQAAGETPAETDDALAGFASEIDAARGTADKLAERYASLTRSVS